MKPIRSVLSTSLALVAAAAMVLSLAGCSLFSDRGRDLEPAPAYAGNTVLFQADGVANDLVAGIQAALAWAERNATYVAAHDNIAQTVARLRKEVDGVAEEGEVLATLYRARDAYAVAANASTQADLDRALGTARALLATARLLVGPTP